MLHGVWVAGIKASAFWTKAGTPRIGSCESAVRHGPAVRHGGAVLLDATVLVVAKLALSKKVKNEPSKLANVVFLTLLLI